MFSSERTLYNYVTFRQPNGQRVSMLPDFMYKMEDCIVNAEKEVPDPTPEEPGRVKLEKTEGVKVTRIVNPFGDQTIVMETQEQIIQQLQSASIDAIKNLQGKIQREIVQAPAGLALPDMPPRSAANRKPR